MPRFQPVQILGGCYSDSDRSFSLQDTVNWLPEQAEQAETRTPSQFKTPPGLRPFLEIPPTVTEGGTFPSKPVRATYNCEGKLFAVIGKTLYQVSNSGVAIPQGTIPGNGRVVMAHNQISQGNELVSVNGSSGYVYNTLTQVFEKITDEGFPGAIWVGFADGYILGIEPGRRFAFNSDPADALNYNTLDRFTSEYKPDLIVTGVVNNSELILLNETSYEFFENTGATQQPFRSKRIYGDVGCASRYGACNLDRTVFMFGADGKFYRLEGYSWQRISTRPIEQAVRGLNWAQAFCFTWEDSGHSVVYWTFPDGLTWGFDQSTNLWHRRKSYGLDRWRPNTSTLLGQEWYMGDFQTGRIWVMDWDYILEGEDCIERIRTTGVLSDNQNLIEVNRFEPIFNTGQEITVPVEFPIQPEGPTLVIPPLPDGNEGESWAGGTFTATGGTPPYSFSQRPGTVWPGNLGPMKANGVVDAKVPSKDGIGTVNARVYDANGLFDDDTDSFIIAKRLSWIMAGGFTDGEQKPSPNGVNWSNPSVAAIGASSYYREGDEVLALRQGSDAIYFSTNLAVSFSSLSAALEFGIIGPARAAKTGDNWFIASTVPNARKYDGSVVTTMGWAAWTVATVKGATPAEDVMFTCNASNGTQIIRRDDDGTSLGATTFRASGAGITLCAGDGVCAGLWYDSSSVTHLFSMSTGGTITHLTCPFATDVALPDHFIRYSKAMEKWVLVQGVNIAYGSTLDALTLATTTLPYPALGIDEDGTKFEICGQSASLHMSIDLDTWIPLAVANASGAPSFTALLSLENASE